MEDLQVISNNDFNQEYKLCVLGQGAVGKTSLAIKFVDGVFISRYDPTIEDVYKKTIEIDEKQFSVEILDTAGTEIFTVMRDLYIRNSKGFAIIYSIASQSTFDQVQLFYNQIMNIKKEQPALVLVGNKVDLSKTERIVHREKGQTLADQWMCPFYETSAKHSINVNQIFMDLIRQIDRRLPYIRKASRQTDIPLTGISPINYYFCCSFFTRKQKKQKQEK
ncbi:unnamed protein product [Rotaria sp. Silwood1]|nr:unnamed protein product [Rotaria sp. Silwood1]